MKTDSEIPLDVTPSRQPLMQRILKWPSTRLGWWSIGLGVAFEVLWIINSTVGMHFSALVPWRQLVLPFYSILMLSCGLAAGILGLIATIKGHERSWLVWLAILPGLFVLLFVLGEFLMPH